MATVQTPYPHIVLNDAQQPSIAGTTMKVVELITAQLAYGWSPEELAFQFPHLTLGQIHSALAYYWDHRDEIEQRIAEDERMWEEGRREQSLLQERIAARESRASSISA